MNTEELHEEINFLASKVHTKEIGTTAFLRGVVEQAANQFSDAVMLDAMEEFFEDQNFWDVASAIREAK